LDLHGFDLKPTSDKNGDYLLYAINHLRNSTETVEKFTYNPNLKQLEWLGNQHSHQEGDLICANTLTIINKDNFLVSNYAGYKNPWLVKAQWLGIFTGGSLTHFNHNSSKIVYNKINKSNGITFSKDRKLLYVSHIGALGIEVFRVGDVDKHEFTRIHTLPIQSMSDNLNIDPDTGDLYASALVSLAEVENYMNSPKRSEDTKCSFKVLRIRAKEDESEDIGYKFDVDTVLEHNGDTLSMATVAAPSSSKNKLLISSILDNGILNCKLNY
jgi:hypothetical protein